MPTTHDAIEGLKAEARREMYVKFKGWILQDADECYRSFDAFMPFIDSLLDRAVKGEKERCAGLARQVGEATEGLKPEEIKVLKGATDVISKAILGPYI